MYRVLILSAVLIFVQPQEFKLLESSKRHLQNKFVQQSYAEWAPLRIEYYFITIPTAQEQANFNSLIDVAKLFFRRYVMVRRVQQRLAWKASYSSKLGEGWTVPIEAQSMSWDADIVLFVGLENDSEAYYLAYAGPVIYEESILKPIFGLIVYNMWYVDFGTFNSNDFETYLQILLHETFHGLGFHESMYEKFYDFKTSVRYPQPVVKENSIVLLTTPRLLALTRNYFGCDSIDGVIMEDYSNSGIKTAASHLERALFYNDMMTHNQEVGNIVFTEFSLQLLQDTGMYRFGDIMTDPILWGKGKGCDFYKKQCYGGTFPEFCQKRYEIGCSFYSTGIGYCEPQSFSNNCVYRQIYSNYDCRDQNIAPNADTFSYFGYDSMCVMGGLSKFNLTIPSFSCYQYECSGNNLTIVVNGLRFNCSTPGRKAAPAGYFGSITCPANPSDICGNLVECPNQCNKRGYCLAAKCLCLPGYSGVDCMDTCSTYRYGITCVTDCPAGTFKEEAIMSCLGCSYKCKTCSAINKCSVCESGYTLYGDFCDINESVSISKLWSDFYLITSSDNNSQLWSIITIFVINILL